MRGRTEGRETGKKGMRERRKGYEKGEKGGRKERKEIKGENEEIIQTRFFFSNNDLK